MKYLIFFTFLLFIGLSCEDKAVQLSSPNEKVATEPIDHPSLPPPGSSALFYFELREKNQSWEHLDNYYKNKILTLSDNLESKNNMKRSALMLFVWGKYNFFDQAPAGTQEFYLDEVMSLDYVNQDVFMKFVDNMSKHDIELNYNAYLDKVILNNFEYINNQVTNEEASRLMQEDLAELQSYADNFQLK